MGILDETRASEYTSVVRDNEALDTEISRLIQNYGIASVLAALVKQKTDPMEQSIAVLKLPTRARFRLIRTGYDTISKAIVVAKAGYPRCLLLPPQSDMSYHQWSSFGPVSFRALVTALHEGGYLSADDVAHITVEE